MLLGSGWTVEVLSLGFRSLAQLPMPYQGWPLCALEGGNVVTLGRVWYLLTTCSTLLAVNHHGGRAIQPE